MASEYDGIILGTGHNALVLQAYLCRCGLKVLSLDRAETFGGGLATVENPRQPGFLHNTHSFFHRALTAMPWYRDLQLEEQGARYVEPELNVALILKDGRSLQWWTDFARTYESFCQFSRRDADALRRWREEFRPILRGILNPEARSPPLAGELRRDLLGRSAAGRRLLEVSSWSPLEFVEREFENDVVRAGLLFFNGLREVDLRQKGFGHSIPALLASDHMAQMCVGGSARLAEALVTDIRKHGGEVRAGAEPKAILVSDGKVRGVELTTGERIETSGFVASGLNPQQTFLKLLDADVSGASLRKQASSFQYNLLAPLFALNLALKEPPKYVAAERDPDLQRAFMVILGLERFGQFGEIVVAHEAGQIPAAVMWGACPTQFDDGQAPAGGHTAFMWEKLPYAINGNPNNWDQLARQHGDEMLRLWTEYAPNLNHALVDSFVRTPLDTERSLPNMQFGDLLVGSFANGQVGENRPFAGAGRYRTPIEGLYLCGGSTHPGGNVTGLCGYNAARVLATDLNCPVWWNPPDAEQALLANIKPMTIRILHGDVHLIDLATRLPFKYGIATMTRAPQALVRLFVEIDGKEAVGVSADVLPPKWFTKVAEKPLDAEISEMLEVVNHAVSCSAGATGQTVFDVWQAVYQTQNQWGRERGLPTLLSQFGTTLVERALIEAFCHAKGKPFAKCLRDNDFGIRLDAFDARLAGLLPGELLPAEPRRRIVARHTVGMADPLEEFDIEAGGRLSDGLPQSLVECIQRYALKHFKLKVAGNIQQDVQRLSRIAVILERHVWGEFAFTLDGNESFRSLDGFREYWERLTGVSALSAFLQRLMFVEQPFHRDVALDTEVLRGLNAWREQPRLIIDESDAELGSLPLAIALGYHGTSHKNCKGVFKGVANACLLGLLKRQPGGEALVMSGEDLANIGPVALLQDLAVVASLGVGSVERNGHHYFAGLSAFPDGVQRQILEQHGDLYEQTPSGWPSLRIEHGELALDSVVDAPLGVGFKLEVTQFTPAEQWKNSY